MSSPISHEDDDMESVVTEHTQSTLGVAGMFAELQTSDEASASASASSAPKQKIVVTMKTTEQSVSSSVRAIRLSA
jgi:hypothetical protein